MGDKGYDAFEAYEVGKPFEAFVYEENKDQEDEQESLIEHPMVVEKNEVMNEGVIDIKYEEEQEAVEEERDTSFNTYRNENSQKPEGVVSKWFMRIAKVALFIALMPLMVLLGGIIGGWIAGLFGGGIVLVCLGIGVLVGGAFFSTTLSGTMIALMVSLAVTLAASGGFAFLCGILCCKTIMRIIKYYKKKQTGEAVGEAEK